jgi:RHS repeat-associated protein
VGAYGYYQDWETGLTLLTFRYYDAEAGRFVTRDPIGFKGGELALYVYTTLPTLMIDPSGRAAGFAANGDDDLGPKCTLQKNNPSDVSCQDCGDEKLVAALIDKVKDLGKEFAKCVAGCVGKTGTELRNCVVECAGKSPKGPDLVISIRNYMLCEDTACLINPDWMAPGGCAKCLG